MALDEQLCKDTYQKTWQALNTVAASLTLSNDVVKEARLARNLVDAKYRDKVKSDVNERTEQFQSFIKDMQAALATISRDDTVGHVVKLTGLIGDARELLAVNA